MHFDTDALQGQAHRFMPKHLQALMGKAQAAINSGVDDAMEGVARRTFLKVSAASGFARGAFPLVAGAQGAGAAAALGAAGGAATLGAGAGVGAGAAGAGIASAMVMGRMPGGAAVAVVSVMALLGAMASVDSGGARGAAAPGGATSSAGAVVVGSGKFNCGGPTVRSGAGAGSWAESALCQAKTPSSAHKATCPTAASRHCFGLLACWASRAWAWAREGDSSKACMVCWCTRR